MKISKFFPNLNEKMHVVIFNCDRTCTTVGRVCMRTCLDCKLLYALINNNSIYKAPNCQRIQGAEKEGGKDRTKIKTTSYKEGKRWVLRACFIAHINVTTDGLKVGFYVCLQKQ